LQPIPDFKQVKTSSVIVFSLPSWIPQGEHAYGFSSPIICLVIMELQDDSQGATGRASFR
jgi:hypothetical protein